jgi:hypothetical protein
MKNIWGNAVRTGLIAATKFEFRRIFDIDLYTENVPNAFNVSSIITDFTTKFMNTHILTNTTVTQDHFRNLSLLTVVPTFNDTFTSFITVHNNINLFMNKINPTSMLINNLNTVENITNLTNSISSGIINFVDVIDVLPSVIQRGVDNTITYVTETSYKVATVLATSTMLTQGFKLATSVEASTATKMLTSATTAHNSVSKLAQNIVNLNTVASMVIPQSENINTKMITDVSNTIVSPSAIKKGVELIVGAGIATTSFFTKYFCPRLRNKNQNAGNKNTRKKYKKVLKNKTSKNIMNKLNRKTKKSKKSKKTNKTNKTNKKKQNKKIKKTKKH